MGIKITLERYDVQVVGSRYQFDAKMEPVGRALDYLNSEDRSTFPLFDVRMYPIAPTGRLGEIARPEITVMRSELGLIYFLDAAYRRQVQPLKNFDQVIAYTSHVVLRGNFHHGAETRLRDLFEIMQGSFFPMTEVSLFPTTELPAAFPQQADLLIVNRNYVNLYHLN